VDNLTIDNLRIDTDRDGMGIDCCLPEPSMFGATPCYGVFLRPVRGITLENIGLHTLTPDERPAFTLADVTGLRARSADGLPDAR